MVDLRKDKGMLEQSVSVEKPESVNREVRACELRCRESVVRARERERERERSIRCDESCKLTIELSRL